MFSVALIGADGAGKSTIARKLESSFQLPARCLYMGINLESTNIALPTSRFVGWIKRCQNGKAAARLTKPASRNRSDTRQRKESGKLWAALRLLNRLAEEWYRQLVAWNQQRKGKIVVFDRYFLYDFQYSRTEADGKSRRFTDWFHRWCLAKLYPRPDLVIFLDAPAEVLFARKREGTIQWLESRRQAFLRQGKQIPNFIRIDATQPVETVYADVAKHLLRYYQVQRAPTLGVSEIT